MKRPFNVALATFFAAGLFEPRRGVADFGVAAEPLRVTLLFEVDFFGTAFLGLARVLVDVFLATTFAFELFFRFSLETLLARDLSACSFAMATLRRVRT